METPPYTHEPLKPVVVTGALDKVSQAPAPPNRARRRFARLRRRIDRLRPDRDAAEPVEGDRELKLELTLLREENIRLKTERHRPFDVGTLIDQLRLRSDSDDRIDSADEAWAVLGDYLRVRENLAQANVEIEAAIAAIEERLGVVLDDETLDRDRPSSARVAEAA